MKEREREIERKRERKREAGSEGGRWGRKNFDLKAAAAVFCILQKGGQHLISASYFGNIFGREKTLEV